VPREAIARALREFAGVDRRLQVTGSVTLDGGDAVLVDDYGHHPREIVATVDAVRAAWPGRRLVVAFQPHRYTRTRDLFDDFAEALSGLEILYLFEVYPAGERPISGADGRALARAIRARGRTDPIFVADVKQLPTKLRHAIRPNDVVLTLGAGNIGQVAATLPDALAARRVG
jgi:UDP-N-acetylmuramate--alanine ligase